MLSKTSIAFTLGVYFSELTGNPNHRLCCTYFYFIVLLNAVTGRRQMTVQLPNGEFTLFLKVANLSKVIREQCLRGTCTMSCHPGILGILVALRSGGQEFPRASAACCRRALTPLLPSAERHLMALRQF